MMPSPNIQRIAYKNFQLAYRKLGYGPAVMLAFHGIGQDSTCFMPLTNTIGDQFTIYSFDLFFHGGTQLHKSSAHEFVLTKTDWTQIISQFLEENGIDRFSVMGFSMGGKFALVTAEAFAGHIDQLLLLAPDGITTSPWYSMATASEPGRWLFRYFLHHIPLLSRFGHAMTAIGMLDRSALRFAQSTLSTVEQRERVYLSWIGFRLLKVNLDTLANRLNHHPVRVRFFQGYFDRVLPVQFLNPLTKRLHAYELIMLKTGHHRLVEKAAAFI